MATKTLMHCRVCLPNQHHCPLRPSHIYLHARASTAKILLWYPLDPHIPCHLYAPCGPSGPIVLPCPSHDYGHHLPLLQVLAPLRDIHPMSSLTADPSTPTVLVVSAESADCDEVLALLQQLLAWPAAAAMLSGCLGTGRQQQAAQVG